MPDRGKGSRGGWRIVQSSESRDQNAEARAGHAATLPTTMYCMGRGDDHYLPGGWMNHPLPPGQVQNEVSSKVVAKV
jgi:hypothetical protein